MSALFNRNVKDSMGYEKLGSSAEPFNSIAAGSSSTKFEAFDSLPSTKVVDFHSPDLVFSMTYVWSPLCYMETTNSKESKTRGIKQ
jgi:hypothetical protein